MSRPVVPIPHRWFAPLLWIALTPIITVPLTIFLAGQIGRWASACQVSPGFFGATANCSAGPVLLMLTPGLINIAPIWWFRRNDRKTRSAAGWASALGTLRLAVPAIAVLATPDGESMGGGFLNGYPNAYWGLWLVVTSLVLWLMTFPVMWLVARTGR